jgi:geranyl-CoA carboxylase alpha subunit
MTIFDTVLVANRGEIAVRVLRAARKMGYRTVALYSDADQDSPHTKLADRALRLGPGPAAESYLKIDRIIELASSSGANAVHPGYGFLAENADFAQACQDAGLVFIGPAPAAIRQMGDKAQARQLMIKAQLPLLPGYQGQDQSLERLLKEARALGLPLMIKAAAGGGGKGMRLVNDLSELQSSIEAVRRESQSAFGHSAVILERALLRPRHVEIQVLADNHGHMISLGERDCSIQRRHQKIIEESPGPGISENLRQRMSAAAISAARAVNYTGAGTVEFLLSESGDFYFLEMNTRLQVEHPVTELVTGLDLVEWQLKIARGERLTLTQEDVRLSGHAIETRLYAEDPALDFLPSTGPLLRWAITEEVRVDAGVEQQNSITAFYDPMLAKIIAHGADREEARRRLICALKTASVLGLKTNRAFLLKLLQDPNFIAAELSTAFIAESNLCNDEISTSQVAAMAAILQKSRQDLARGRSPGLEGWSNAVWLSVPMVLRVNDSKYELAIQSQGPSTMTLRIGEDTHTAQFHKSRLRIDDVDIDYDAHIIDSDNAWIRLGDSDFELRDALMAPPKSKAQKGHGTLLAPMHGRVSAVYFKAGDTVSRGDPLLVLEAMKMEHSINADRDGVIKQIVAVDLQVASDDILAQIITTEQSDSELQ